MPGTHQFTLTDHGSIVLLKPETAAAQAWCDEHLDPERQTWAGAVVVEHRYVEAILDAITSDFNPEV